MEKTTAQRTVRETLKAPFDRERYRKFISELCNGFDETKKAPMLVPDAFAAHVKSCQRLGTFTAPEGELADVLIVNLTESYKLDRTRTALRDFVAHKLKRGDGDDNHYKEAGLVAFVSPDSQSWRFSYVRMEYGTKRDPKTGKIKPEERLTPARRFSYLVGADEECHTAQTRFLALLQNTADHPTLGQIEEAFSVEAVTKEFFREYARLFAETNTALEAVVKRDKAIRTDFEAKGVKTVDFAKKLLGQIVFLYFIQKKGWLGVAKSGKWGDGPRNFMRQLADKAIGAKQGLFNDILEPLFYDTLATDRGEAAWCKTFQCRIPFLNGGLFEPLAGYEWEKTEIDLPNALFTNKEHSPAGDVGTGILDVFDRYNFTVNEAEPLEKEVAIDPEMLGKVFENLIEENRRKGLGAFYTPREIVHYMCQESLINYLDTAINTAEEPIGKEKATHGKLFTPPAPGQKSLKIATYRELIPRADIETFIHLGEQISHYEAVETNYAGKKMPKGIEKHARLMDDKLADITICDPAVGSGAFPVGMMTEIVRARRALTPYFKDAIGRTAYDFKRHAIQSCLYGVDIDAGAVEIAKLRLWLSLVVDEENVQDIQPLPNLDYKIVAGNSLLGVEINLFNIDQFKELEALKPEFFDESDRQRKATLKKKIEDLIHRLTDGREVFDFKIYFSEVFHAKQGFDVVLGNPPYGADIPASELVEIKKRVQDTTNSNSAALFIDFGKNKVSHAAGTVAFIVPKSLLYSEDWFSLVKSMVGETSKVVDVEKAFERVLLEQVVFVLERQRKSATYLARKFLNNKFVSQTVISNECVRLFEAWVCDVSEKEIRLGERLRRNNARLADSVTCFRGFPIQRVIKEKGFYSVIGGINLRKFGVKGVKGYLTKSDYESLGTKIDRLAQPKLMAQNLVAHIQNPRPHIKLITAFDESGEVMNLDTVTNIVLKTSEFSPKVLLAILNSAMVSWYAYRFIFCSAIRTMHFDKHYVGKIPVPVATPEKQKPIVALVDRILTATRLDASVDTHSWELELDELVFDLYGLTSAERAVVQGATG